ncbi:MAG: tRNA lysidine(34) synthetase TilS, partial [Thermoanaerobaculia bacterium]
MSPLLATLDGFFRSTAPAGAGDLIVVAFSGGPDSTALLAALRRLAPERGWRLLAAHLDHGMDPGSRGRAEGAREIAERLGVEVVAERRPVPEAARRREGPEAAARRARYRFLEDVRAGNDGLWIATAHHRDDQAETVLLRMLQGSGVEGLAGIRPVRGRLVRPILALPRRE